MKDYKVRIIPCAIAKQYIIKHHYSHGCHNAPSPCFGLYDGDSLIGCCMFACPCSENVRRSVFGDKMKNSVIELHRLHILDVTPPNTESWFIVRCLKMLSEVKPRIKAVISFSDRTMGHEGVIYKATNAFRIGGTSKTTFYLDKDGRLRHPRQNGVNISIKEAEKRGWTPTIREAKNRYLYIIANNKKEAQHLKELCKYNLDNVGHPIICKSKSKTLF